MRQQPVKVKAFNVANLEVIPIELLKASLQSLGAGAVATSSVRHEHHHMLPLPWCQPFLACMHDIIAFSEGGAAGRSIAVFEADMVICGTEW